MRFPNVDASIGAKDKVLKAIRDAVADHLRLDAAHVIHEAATTGIKRNVRYHYPGSAVPDYGPLSSGVLLEMGCRGGTYPTQQHQLRSMIAEYAIDQLGESPEAWDEFAPVAVEVLAPTRTLLEKLALLHDAASRSEQEGEQRLLKSGRHVYDTHQLLACPDVTAELEAIGREGVVQLCADIDEHSRAAAFSFTPRPDGGYVHSPLLDPSHPSREALKRDYNAAMALVYGVRPSFEDCIAAIATHAALL